MPVAPPGAWLRKQRGCGSRCQLKGAQQMQAAILAPVHRKWPGPSIDRGCFNETVATRRGKKSNPADLSTKAGRSRPLGAHPKPCDGRFTPGTPPGETLAGLGVSVPNTPQPHGMGCGSGRGAGELGTRSGGCQRHCAVTAATSKRKPRSSGCGLRVRPQSRLLDIAYPWLCLSFPMCQRWAVEHASEQGTGCRCRGTVVAVFRERNAPRFLGFALRHRTPAQPKGNVTAGERAPGATCTGRGACKTRPRSLCVSRGSRASMQLARALQLARLVDGAGPRSSACPPSLLPAPCRCRQRRSCGQGLRLSMRRRRRRQARARRPSGRLRATWPGCRNRPGRQRAGCRGAPRGVP